MAGNASTGSPIVRRPLASKSVTMEDNIMPVNADSAAAEDQTVAKPSLKKALTTISTASLVNQSCPKLAKKMKLNHDALGPSDASGTPESNSMDRLLADLTEQSAKLQKHGEAYKFAAHSVSYLNPGHHLASHSMPPTPATEDFNTTAPSTRPTSATTNGGQSSEDEVNRLKKALADAQNEINNLKGQPAKPEFGSSPPAPGGDYAADQEISSGPAIAGPSAILPSQPNREQANHWNGFDDSRSDISEAYSANGFNRARAIWGNGSRPGQAIVQNQSGYTGNEMPHTGAWGPRNGHQGFMEPPVNYSGSSGDMYHYNDMTVRAPGGRRGGRSHDSRFGVSSFGSQSSYGNGYNNYGQMPFDAGSGNMPGSGQYPMGMGPYANQQQAPVGTPLSPLATEFTSSSSGGPWKTEPLATEGPTYLPTTEPLNYRRLLDRNVNCNWKYIVDKIVCNNDQQASIFLQQKLKVGTPDQKYEIVDAIILQAHALMVNRFGNFLVQRCFEHGTPEQVIKIAEALRGHTLNLSMDPFGCHVIQKAFDSVPEDYKCHMVGELLRDIPKTVIHRYACHVWQKLFELRWTESPPQIMKYVNDALEGMWHDVALGETGSLVVQNIFENCLEEDKRPCIEEVLQNIDIVAHGQFGNWCIQHICEHGAPADRSRAIDHVIRFAAEYSMDQYASKVVEKCLKIGSPEFLARYLDRVCEGRMDRPRIPLIDIASDQYGNYLIQYILTNASPQHREIVAAHIRKHMVSLRGSKFGSRVGMLCTNPAVATRPGPCVSANLGRMPQNARWSRSYQ
ncbi:Pumilio-family RNA binding repeat protein [Apiospora phragmitis]|uniref:Pumilio-family RNA binding repeat protein n=1 Tax=Apiospora phragmitis TaxID=2905665 RepID=A0ABR1WTW5_9PEZI